MEVKIKLNKTSKRDILILSNGKGITKKEFINLNISDEELERLNLFEDVLIKNVDKKITSNSGNINETFIEDINDNDTETVNEDTVFKETKNDLDKFIE